jgi:hypothetical protein
LGQSGGQFDPNDEYINNQSKYIILKAYGAIEKSILEHIELFQPCGLYSLFGG